VYNAPFEKYFTGLRTFLFSVDKKMISRYFHVMICSCASRGAAKITSSARAYAHALGDEVLNDECELETSMSIVQA